LSFDETKVRSSRMLQSSSSTMSTRLARRSVNSKAWYGVLAVRCTASTCYSTGQAVPSVNGKFSSRKELLPHSSTYSSGHRTSGIPRKNAHCASLACQSTLKSARVRRTTVSTATRWLKPQPCKTRIILVKASQNARPFSNLSLRVPLERDEAILPHSTATPCFSCTTTSCATCMHVLHAKHPFLAAERGAPQRLLGSPTRSYPRKIFTM
jgi:hypothetical protein